MASKATATRLKLVTTARPAQASADARDHSSIPADLEADALVCHVLVRAGLSVDDANKAKPGDGTDTYFLCADRATAAYRKSRRAFAAHVPGFDMALADVGSRLLQHAKVQSSSWEKVRVARAKGEGRRASMKEAASLRARVIALSRFAFRASAEVTAELDRIARGKRIADLVTNLDDLAALMRAHASTYAKLTKLHGAAGRAAELALILRTQPDRVRAATRLASRNRALVALGVALKEIRTGAKVLHVDDPPNALAPYRAASTARSRVSRARARSKAKARPHKGSDAPEARKKARPMKTRGQKKRPARSPVRPA